MSGAHTPCAAWLMIESAPKDACILLASMGVKSPGQDRQWSITAGYWDAEFEAVLTEDDDDAYRGAWTDGSVESWGYEQRTELYPTHWMPLPAPPITPGDPS